MKNVLFLGVVVGIFRGNLSEHEELETHVCGKSTCHRWGNCQHLVTWVKVILMFIHFNIL